VATVPKERRRQEGRKEKERPERGAKEARRGGATKEESPKEGRRERRAGGKAAGGKATKASVFDVARSDTRPGSAAAWR